jgi:hypothetical protein
MGRLKNWPQNGYPKTQPHCHKKKVENFTDMQHALAKIDLFNLNWIPDSEPRRRSEWLHYVASGKGRLLFMRICLAPE